MACKRSSVRARLAPSNRPDEAVLGGRPGTEPYVVCREASRLPQSPVLCSSLEEARAFARNASESTNLPPSGWRAFRGERLVSPVERLFVQGQNGSVLLRSELEDALSQSRSTIRARAFKPSKRRNVEVAPRPERPHPSHAGTCTPELEAQSSSRSPTRIRRDLNVLPSDVATAARVRWSGSPSPRDSRGW
jgi:hypothetical protein